MVADTAENRDLGKGFPNITSSGSLETVGTGILILERLQLTLVFTRGQLCSFVSLEHFKYYSVFNISISHNKVLHYLSSVLSSYMFS